MSIVVTGASGKVGRLTVEALLRRGVPAADIVATGRAAACMPPLFLADTDLGMSRGELYTGSGDLSRPIGRPATALSDAIAAALR
ncbi:hypothetical protein ACIP10_10745 [Streptomyces galbus]|uniref:hypothetical protein n=1 Tax=Streptomyces galbus TaxID=33898 RepID=UPI0037A8307E